MDSASSLDCPTAVASAQAGLVHALAQPGAPVAVQQLLHQVQTGLNVLQDTTARLQAGNQRALGVLFPPDQVRTYSQLGAKGYGAPGRSSGTSFKA